MKTINEQRSEWVDTVLNTWAKLEKSVSDEMAVNICRTGITQALENEWNRWKVFEYSQCLHLSLPILRAHVMAGKAEALSALVQTEKALDI